jgi:hypothetical protein
MIPLTYPGTAWCQYIMKGDIPRPLRREGATTQSMAGHHRYANVGV